MAMIACSRCRKQISSEATACRHCGAKRSINGDSYTPRPNFALHYLLSMVMAVAGAAIYITGLNGADHASWVAASAPILFVGGTVWYVGTRIWAYVA